MAGETDRRTVHPWTGSPSEAPEPADGKRRLIRGEGLVARISNDYRPQLPVVGKDIPGPAVLCDVGTARLLETVNIRTRSVGRAVCRLYSDSDESDNDVMYAELLESTVQQVSLRNDWLTPTADDSCGKWCAQLDDFNWFLIADDRAGDILASESEIEVSDSEGEVEYIETDSTPMQKETVVSSGETYVMGSGSHSALPRRLRRGRDVLTEDGAVAVDTERVSAASDTVVSRETHRNSECVPTVVPKLAAALQAASEVVQLRPPDSGCTDLRPPVDKCLESLGLDTPDPVESGMEVTGGSPPAVSDISVGPDVLQTARSVTTQVSEKWMVIDSPDAVESGMEMAAGSPPAEVDISVGPDVLPTAVSVTTEVSDKWMERVVINLDVLGSDGLSPDDDPAGESSDVGSDVCVVLFAWIRCRQAVSVRTVVTEKWMDQFVIDLVECPSVSRTSAVARTFGPAVFEEYSPVVFAGGGGGRLPMHQCRISGGVLQDSGSRKNPAIKYYCVFIIIIRSPCTLHIHNAYYQLSFKLRTKNQLQLIHQTFSKYLSPLGYV